MATGDEILVQVDESPIVLQFTKQGIEGATGPTGPKGEKGDTWELEIVMAGSPDGQCTMKLYKDGELCTDIHYVQIFRLDYDSDAFQSSTWDRNISGTYTFDYTNLRALKAVVYEDASKELVLCTRTCNYGKSATVTVGNVTNVEQGSEYVNNTGNAFDAVFDFGLPRGRAATISVGTTTTLPAGSNATVTQRGTTADRIFDFGIPNGGGSGARVEPNDTPSNTLILDAGAIYTPSVNSSGVLSWTNNASLENPDPVQVTVDMEGTWSASTAYQRLDVVNYNGSSYIAKQDVPAGTALTNTTYWQCVAERGDDGVVMYATFDVDISTGQLVMYTDTGYDGANFSLTSAGYLQVTI